MVVLYLRVVKKYVNLSFIAGELSCLEISKLCLSKLNTKINEFIRNIECFQLSEDIFDNFTKECLFKINISNFLIICLAFEKIKKINLSNYIKVISAISKTFQNSIEKNMVIINFFKKLDKNNLFLRIVDIY